VLTICFGDLKPKTDVLAGAALGEKHGGEIESAIAAQSAGRDIIVLLDFREIKAVTSSYLKQTVRRLHGDGNSGASEPRIFPLYCNLSPSPEDDVHHFLLAHHLPGVLVRVKGNTATFERRLGWLEGAAQETLFRLSLINAGSAADVMATQGGSAIALTAWNNRLAELFRLRLATREKRGRHWIYKPIVEVKNNG
jgi:hypothetical protein